MSSVIILPPCKTTSVNNLALTLVMAFFLLWFSLPVSAAAIYNLTFNGTWNNNDVDGALPANAHFTSLYGATHSAGNHLWAPGELATTGIENVAELGDGTQLLAEIGAATAAGTIATSFVSSSLFGLPNSSSTTLIAFDSHPFISAISMIAPSPDWFVGVSDLSLKDSNGWISDLTVDLIPWDAGTEAGNLFNLNNPALASHVSIASLTDSPFIGTPVIGSLHLELVSVPIPASVWLFLSGLAVLVRVSRRS